MKLTKNDAVQWTENPADNQNAQHTPRTGVIMAVKGVDAVVIADPLPGEQKTHEEFTIPVASLNKIDPNFPR